MTMPPYKTNDIPPSLAETHPLHDLQNVVSFDLIKCFCDIQFEEQHRSKAFVVVADCSLHINVREP